jgi:hypothetical protein
MLSPAVRQDSRSLDAVSRKVDGGGSWTTWKLHRNGYLTAAAKLEHSASAQKMESRLWAKAPQIFSCEVSATLGASHGPSHGLTQVGCINTSLFDPAAVHPGPRL